MSKFFEYDPVTGIGETQIWDGDTVTVHQQQDVEALVEECKTKANSGLTDKGIKGNFWHYAELPMVEVVNLRRKGIDIWDKNCTKDLFKAINRDLPAFKVTQKLHR